MKKLYALAFFFLLSGLTISCKHEIINAPRSELPAVVTAAVSAITSTAATSGGEVTSEGASAVIARGVVWSSSPQPVIGNLQTTNGTGLGQFISELRNLNANTTYYVRAYATNSSGTAYGDEVSFSTPPSSTSNFAAVKTTSPSYNSSTSAITSGGEVVSSASPVTSRGIVWAFNANPTLANNVVASGTGLGIFSSTVASAAPGNTYHIRAFATNSAGTAYGESKSITISSGSTPVAPTVTTANATSTMTTIATGGNVTADGGANVTARGVCWSTTPNPTVAGSKTSDGTGTGSFISNITNLAANTTYYIRAYATNSVATAYGMQITVKTATASGHFIGENFGGGVIFYVDATGQHGLIAAISDQGNRVWDYNSNTSLLGANSNSNGAGNTTTIISSLGTSQNYAALIARNYAGGGYNDWFLPAVDQLDSLYQHRAVVGNFTTGDYWTSTEDNNSKAWMIQFESGSNGGRRKEENKDKSLRVRPIRSF